MPGLLQPQRPALFSGQQKPASTPALPSQATSMPTQAATRPPMPTQAMNTAQRPPMPSQAQRPPMPSQARNTAQRPPMPSQSQRAPTQAAGAPRRTANAFGQQTAAAARARPLQATTQRRGSVPPTRLR